MKTVYKIILLVLVIGVVILSIITLHQCSNKPKETVITKIDTTYIVKYDTITYTRTINNNIYNWDTIVVKDTVYIKDEPRLYTDSTSDYKVNINCVKLYDYDLQLYRKDSIVYVNKEIERTIENTKHWSQGIFIGVGGGYGIGKDLKLSPFIGVTISYGFGYTW